MTKSRPPFLRNFFQGRDAAKKKFIAGTISPLVLYMAFWTIFPLLWGVALAFFEYSPRRVGGFLGFGGDNPFIGLQNFQSMTNISPDAPLQIQQFHTGIKITLLFAVIIVPLNLLLSLPLAFLIESVHQRAKNIYRTLFFLPVLAPSVGVAIMWGFIYHPQRGLLNAIIGKFAGKLIGINWTGDPNLTVGTTVYFPVFVPGALFSIGDTHAVQGLGEVSGTAMEAPMRIVYRISVLESARTIEEVQYETDSYYATTGFAETIDEAARKATRFMVDHLVETRGLSREDAYMLCSIAGNLHIAEVVDVPHMLVTMHIPKSIFLDRDEK